MRNLYAQQGDSLKTLTHKIINLPWTLQFKLHVVHFLAFGGKTFLGGRVVQSLFRRRANARNVS